MKIRRAYSGFTLLELSIVLTIIAVMLAGGAVTFSASVQKRQEDETRVKLAAIQKALLEYRRAYNRLPCQSNITTAMSASTYGVSLGSIGAYEASGSCGNTNFSASDVTSIKAGGVPVRTLNLPDDYAIDGWGNRFLYAVDQRLTVYDAFTSIAITDTTTRITILDSNGGNTKTVGAIYTVVSYGPNAHGSYPRVGGSTRAFLGSTNTDEFENCDCTATAAGTFDAVFVQRLPTQASGSVVNIFDDMVVFATRRDLSSPLE